METINLHDLVIRNGKILDGSGKKPFFGDIAIDGGKITSVGKIESSGKEEFDAKGNLVCLLYTSPSPRDRQKSRMPSSA